MALRILCTLVLALGFGCSGNGGAAKANSPKVEPKKKVTKKSEPDAPPKTPAAMTFKNCGKQSCMIHPGTTRYHLCLHAVDGRCAHYGGACSPADSCMYSAKSKSFRSCTSVGEGECMTFGAVCEPKSKCVLHAPSGQHRECRSFTAGACSSFGDACAP